MMVREQLDNVVESICNRGCRYVNSLLDDETSRLGCSELKALGQLEQAEVLKELRCVMSVYDITNSCDC